MYEGGVDTYGKADADLKCCICFDAITGMKILSVLTLIEGILALF